MTSSGSVSIGPSGLSTIPILFGVFSASFLGGVYYVLGVGRLRPASLLKSGIVVLSVFFSLSTGPYLTLLAQFFVMLWDRISRGLQCRWWLLAGSIAGLYVVVDLLSNRTPFHVLVSYFSLSSRSAYNRILIWEYGSAEVARHPLFGIGFAEWLRPPWMSGSMDNFWLLEAVRYGLPATLLLVAAVLWLGYRLGRLKLREPQLRNGRMAWMVTMVGFALGRRDGALLERDLLRVFLLRGKRRLDAGAYAIECCNGSTPGSG